MKVEVVIAVLGLIAILAAVFATVETYNEVQEYEKQIQEMTEEYSAALSQIKDLNYQLQMCRDDVNYYKARLEEVEAKYDVIREYTDVLTNVSVALNEATTFFILYVTSPDDLNCDYVLEEYLTDQTALSAYQDFLEEHGDELIEMGVFTDSETISNEIRYTETFKGMLDTAHRFCVSR